MIMAVFIRRLKPGATFEDFIREWEADSGFGVPTRVFNAQSLEDPRDIISVGFVNITAEEFAEFMASPPSTEEIRHDRIETVIEKTTLKCQYDIKAEHDFTATPDAIQIGSTASLLHGLLGN